MNDGNINDVAVVQDGAADSPGGSVDHGANGEGQKGRKAQLISGNAVELLSDRTRHLLVTLPANISVLEAFQNPECWSNIQSGPNAFRVFDAVNILSSNGCLMYAGCYVRRATQSGVWFTKPTMIIEAERAEVLYQEKDKRIVAQGTGYQVERLVKGKRGEPDRWVAQGFTYETESKAKYVLMTERRAAERIF